MAAFAKPIRAVTELLEAGHAVGLGRTSKVIADAEQAISDYHGGLEALVLSSGHSALMCALMGLEIGPGDEVITTPYTWGASISCILAVGAIPVLVDVDPDTGLLDPAAIEPPSPHARKPSLPCTSTDSPVICMRGQIEARRKNVDAFRKAMASCRFIRLPDYPRGFSPSYHILTMNYVESEAGVSRATILKALNAEGVGIGPYVPSAIYTWPRLQWKNYQGPMPPWMDQLRRANTDYASLNLPNCQRKLATALEIGWNYYRPAEADMKRLAAAFLKVQDNLPALAKWEQEQSGNSGKSADGAIITAARRAVAAYRRKK